MVAALIISCFQRDKTYFGRYNYSIGGNEGLLVNTRKVRMLSSVTTELFVAVVANAYDNYQRQPVLNRNNLPYGPLRPFILWGSAFAFLQIFAGAQGSNGCRLRNGLACCF